MGRGGFVRLHLLAEFGECGTHLCLHSADGRTPHLGDLLIRHLSIEAKQEDFLLLLTEFDDG